MKTTPKKGPFWIVSNDYLDGVINQLTAKMIAYPVDIDIYPVPSHKDVWEVLQKENKVSWNYFPRGRVEICRGKAIVFANTECYMYPELLKKIRDIYNLDDMEIIFKADNSVHYTRGY